MAICGRNRHMRGGMTVVEAGSPGREVRADSGELPVASRRPRVRGQTHVSHWPRPSANRRCPSPRAAGQSGASGRAPLPSQAALEGRCVYRLRSTDKRGQLYRHRRRINALSRLTRLDNQFTHETRGWFSSKAIGIVIYR